MASASWASRLAATEQAAHMHSEHTQQGSCSRTAHRQTGRDASATAHNRERKNSGAQKVGLWTALLWRWLRPPGSACLQDSCLTNHKVPSHAAWLANENDADANAADSFMSL
jgi:hypothetical protein